MSTTTTTRSASTTTPQDSPDTATVATQDQQRAAKNAERKAKQAAAKKPGPVTTRPTTKEEQAGKTPAKKAPAKGKATPAQPTGKKAPTAAQLKRLPGETDEVYGDRLVGLLGSIALKNQHLKAEKAAAKATQAKAKAAPTVQLTDPQQARMDRVNKALADSSYNDRLTPRHVRGWDAMYGGKAALPQLGLSKAQATAWAKGDAPDSEPRKAALTALKAMAPKAYLVWARPACAYALAHDAALAKKAL